MENLIYEIQKLALMKIGSVYPVYQGEDVVYLNRSNSGYAIAIPFNDERTFNETFVGISLSTNMLNVNDNSFKVLYLFMNDTGDLKKFSFNVFIPLSESIFDNVCAFFALKYATCSKPDFPITLR